MQLYSLRKLMQGSEEAPKAPLGNNARPVQPLYQRTIRTNINFKNSEVSTFFYTTFITSRKLSCGMNSITVPTVCIYVLTRSRDRNIEGFSNSSFKLCKLYWENIQRTIPILLVLRIWEITHLIVDRIVKLGNYNDWRCLLIIF